MTKQPRQAFHHVTDDLQSSTSGSRQSDRSQRSAASSRARYLSSIPACRGAAERRSETRGGITKTTGQGCRSSVSAIMAPYCRLRAGRHNAVQYDIGIPYRLKDDPPSAPRCSLRPLRVVRSRTSRAGESLNMTGHGRSLANMAMSA